MMNKPRVLDVEMLEQAIEQFTTATGIGIEWVKKSKTGKADALIKFKNIPVKFYVELKRWADRTGAGMLIKTMATVPENGLLVADYINPQMAQRLKEANVQFIDAAGNAYINQPPLFVFIQGNKKTKQPKTKPTGLAFSGAGLRVLFTLLNEPDAVNYTYRKLAEGVALGTVANLFDELKMMGFLLEDKNKRRRLLNKRKLFELWVENYPLKLRNKNDLGVYVAEDFNWWVNYPINKHHGNWGGEVAAAIQTNYLKPAEVTVYIPIEEKFNLIQKAKLKRLGTNQINDKNTVQLFQKFWLDHETKTTPPLITYADLVTTADPRNLEAADLIYTKHLKDKIEND